MDFSYLLIGAKSGNMECVEQLMEMYAPMMFKEAVVDGGLDEDLLQEFRLTLFICIQKFQIFR